MDASLLDRKERPPYVRFERRPIEDHAETQKQGRYIARDVDYALITPAYSKDVFIQPVREWFDQLKIDVSAQRLPQEWFEHFQKNYKFFCEGQEAPLNGTPIRGWNVISPAQQQTIIAMHILTVEDLAAVNDEGIRRIGMGGIDLKNKANAWLAQMQDKGPITIKMAQLESENTRLHTDIKQLTETVEALKAAMELKTGVQRASSSGITAEDILDDEPSEELLRAAYKQKFGKMPHPNINIETLKAKVAG